MEFVDKLEVRSLGLDPDEAEPALRGIASVIDNIKTKHSKYKEYPRVDTRKAQDFLESFDLEVTPPFYLTERQLKKYKHNLGKHVIKKELPREISGTYDVYSGSTVVLTKTPVAKESGPKLLESLAVHEMAHSSGDSLMTIDLENYDLYLSRFGFLPQNESEKGSFLEEGFAEMMRGLYVDKVLDRRQGFGSPPEIRALQKKLQETGFGFPAKYSSIAKGKSHIMLGPSSWAALSMEILIIQNPDLVPTIFEARKSPEKLNEFYASVNSIKPGLVAELANIKQEHDECIRGFEIVTRACRNTLLSYNEDEIASRFGL